MAAGVQRRRGRIVSGYGAAAAAIAVMGACSSGIGAPGVVETRAPTNAVAATTTSSVPVTLPPTDPVTVPSTTTPATSTTTAATSTTLDPVAAEQAAVAAAAVDDPGVRG